MIVRYKKSLLVAAASFLLVQRELGCNCYVVKHQRTRKFPTKRNDPPSYCAIDSSLNGFSTNRRNKVRKGNSLKNQKSFIAPTTPQEKSTFSVWKTTTGILIGTSIIYGLAGTSDIESADPILRILPIGTVTNVLDATVPTSSTGFVAGALGEALAGIIGASLSAVLRVLASADRKPLVTEALSDSDYFIMRAGLLPTLEAVGIPPVFASIGSVLFASVPSQLVKLNSKQRQRLAEEERSLREMLVAELQNQKKKNAIRERARAIRRVRPVTPERKVDPSSLTPVSESKVDFIEVFSDVTRWLGYNVLMTDYGDRILWAGVPVQPGVSGAILGFLATFSSRLYADLLYGVLGYGPEAKQKEVRSRRTIDWFAYYASSGISAAVLFGVYEQSQGPISRWIQGILAGGFDGCVGSNEFEACFDAYIKANAPGPSPEAQARAFITNVYMVGQRIQDVAGDTSADDIQRLVRAWAVSAASYFHSLF